VDKNDLIDELKKTGRLTAEHVARWRDASDLLAVFDVIGRDGANALVAPTARSTPWWCQEAALVSPSFAEMVMT